MKKIIIASCVAVALAACNNTTKVESNPAVANAAKWIDSITGLQGVTYDSATWANWEAAYNTATSTIDTAALSAEDKAAYAAATAKWSSYKTDFVTKMEEAKAKMNSTIDSSATKVEGAIEEVKADGKTVIEKAIDKGADKAKSMVK